MASKNEPTAAQLSLLDATGSVFVEACPGAGKTEVIVARYVRRAREEPRKGIALVSFTNAAIDEVRTRCSEDGTDLLRAPHFVGTFDSFINRYLTMPLYVYHHGVVPTFVDSWKSVPDTGVRCCANLPWSAGFDLEWFTIEGRDRVALDDERIGGGYADSLKQHADSCRTLINDEGSRIFASLRSQHMLSCSASRAYAEKVLRDGPMRMKLGRLLANRFAEVIVDEAQDCGPEEIAFLKLLKEYGVELVMVADLDQAIYEFRRAVPEEVATFATELPLGDRLNGNFRSSKVICGINLSVRGRGIRDIAMGRYRDVSHSVQLVSYSRLPELPTKFCAIFDKFELDRASCMVLGYKWADARSAAGALSREFGQSIVGCIASAAVVLQQPDSGGKARKEAIDSIEIAILRLCKQAGVPRYKLDQYYESAELSRRWFRDLAVRMALHRDPLQSDAGTYAKALREFASKVAWPPNMNISNLSDAMKAVAKDAWEKATKPDSQDRLPYSSIHGVKGSQFPGVAVIIPSKLQGDATFLDDWYSGNGSQGERRRILYVGVSRAEQVLVLAVHKNQIGRVEAALSRDQVIWERWNGIDAVP